MGNPVYQDYSKRYDPRAISKTQRGRESMITQSNTPKHKVYAGRENQTRYHESLDLKHVKPFADHKRYNL